MHLKEKGQIEVYPEQDNSGHALLYLEQLMKRLLWLNMPCSCQNLGFISCSLFWSLSQLL